MTRLERLDDAIQLAEIHAIGISMDCDESGPNKIRRKAEELANELDAIRERISRDKL